MQLKDIVKQSGYSYRDVRYTVDQHHRLLPGVIAHVGTGNARDFNEDQAVLVGLACALKSVGLARSRVAWCLQAIVNRLTEDVVQIQVTTTGHITMNIKRMRDKLKSP